MKKEARQVTRRLSDRFWEIVELARTDWPRFRSSVREMDEQTLWQLYWTYRAAMGVLRRDEYRAYADPNLAEDGLEDLASWIVAQGKTFYMDIVKHPEWMLPETPDDAFPHGRPLNEISLVLPARFDAPEDDGFYF